MAEAPDVVGRETLPAELSITGPGDVPRLDTRAHRPDPGHRRGVHLFLERFLVRARSSEDPGAAEVRRVAVVDRRKVEPEHLPLLDFALARRPQRAVILSPTRRHHDPARAIGAVLEHQHADPSRDLSLGRADAHLGEDLLEGRVGNVTCPAKTLDLRRGLPHPNSPDCRRGVHELGRGKQRLQPLDVAVAEVQPLLVPQLGANPGAVQSHVAAHLGQSLHRRPTDGVVGLDPLDPPVRPGLARQTHRSQYHRRALARQQGDEIPAEAHPGLLRDEAGEIVEVRFVGHEQRVEVIPLEAVPEARVPLLEFGALEVHGLSLPIANTRQCYHLR